MISSLNKLKNKFYEMFSKNRYFSFSKNGQPYKVAQVSIQETLINNQSFFK